MEDSQDDKVVEDEEKESSAEVKHTLSEEERRVIQDTARTELPYTFTGTERQRGSATQIFGWGRD